jgi:hypothetical protein
VFFDNEWLTTLTTVETVTAKKVMLTAVTTLKKRVVTAQPTNDVPVTAVTNVTTKKEGVGVTNNLSIKKRLF